MDAEARDAMLAQEYLHLQKTVEDFDARALTIKAWSVTFSAAGLGLAYQQHIPVLLLIAALSAATFWLVDADRKVHQHCFYSRIEAIESHFKGAAGSQAEPFQIRHAWYESYHGPRRVPRWIKLPFGLGVMLPHAVIVAAGLLLFRYWPPAS